jgi:hypothetical protein
MVRGFLLLEKNGSIYVAAGGAITGHFPAARRLDRNGDEMTAIIENRKQPTTRRMGGEIEPTL